MTDALAWLFTPLPPAAAFIAYAALGYMVGLAAGQRDTTDERPNDAV